MLEVDLEGTSFFNLIHGHCSAFHKQNVEFR